MSLLVVTAEEIRSVHINGQDHTVSRTPTRSDCEHTAQLFKGLFEADCFTEYRLMVTNNGDLCSLTSITMALMLAGF